MSTMGTMEQGGGVEGRGGVLGEVGGGSGKVVADLVMRSPVNWTAVGFFGGLSGLHAAIAVPAFLNGRWEAFLSAVFAGIFLCIAGVCFLAKTRLVVSPAERRVRMRWGVGNVGVERIVRFAEVRAVRLTLMGTRKRPVSSIEILCDEGDIECPSTKYPRQQALYMAITMGVELIKVLGDEVGEDARAARRD